MPNFLSEKRLICRNLNELSEIADSIISFAGSQKIWLFYGEMGSGKTTLIKMLCNLMNVKENVSSPTYSIANEYRNLEGEIIFHFDFYRIRSETEALDIGFEDYIYSGNRCLIEWPENIPNLLPEEYLKIELSILEESSRLILLSKK